MYFRCPSAKIVSNASVDFPLPDNPVITTSRSRGISTSMFLRLCSRAPRIRIDFCVIEQALAETKAKPRIVRRVFGKTTGGAREHSTPESARKIRRISAAGEMDSQMQPYGRFALSSGLGG